MAALQLKFLIRLENYFPEDIIEHYGPLFHRWLPDGEKDALFLNTGNPKAILKVWFERRGFLEKGFIKFKYSMKEVDPEIVERQAILEGGPLYGLLEIKDISEEELTTIIENKKGDTAYVSFAKKTIQKLIYPSVHNFINILRITFGQYWINPLEKWDSRKDSIGSYCRNLNLEWSSDGGSIWKPFVPDEPISKLSIELKLREKEYFNKYISKDDWKIIGKLIREDYGPSLAVEFLSRAHRVIDQGNIKFAIIEGVTALEAAMDEFIRYRIKESSYQKEYFDIFKEIKSLNKKLIIIATILGQISQKDLEETLSIISIRNKIVHDGWVPPDDIEKKVQTFLETISILIPGPKLRYPTSNPGNKLASIEFWEK